MHQPTSEMAIYMEAAICMLRIQPKRLLPLTDLPRGVS